MTLVDLRASPPKVLGTVKVGKQPTGIAVSPSGQLALVANRGDGTVSVLKLDASPVAEIAKIALGKPDSGPSGVVFTPDGKNALVTRDGDHLVSVLKIDGDKVEEAKRDISVGWRPYGIIMAAHGRWAAAAMPTRCRSSTSANSPTAPLRP